MECPECNIEMDQIDTTYSNVKTNRCEVGEHTGDIYECEGCSNVFIDNHLTGDLERFSY